MTTNVECSDRRWGGAWPRMWPSLRLFSPADFASLPGWSMPRWPDGFPSARHVVDCLAACELCYGLPIERPMEVIHPLKHLLECALLGGRFDGAGRAFGVEVAGQREVADHETDPVTVFGAQLFDRRVHRPAGLALEVEELRELRAALGSGGDAVTVGAHDRRGRVRAGRGGARSGGGPSGQQDDGRRDGEHGYRDEGDLQSPTHAITAVAQPEEPKAIEQVGNSQQYSNEH
jgi:hypothetical protein